MKISSFYINSAENSDITDFIVSEIQNKFYGIGSNSIAISKFMSFFRKVIYSFIKYKYEKTLKILITIPRMDEKLIIKDDYNDDIIKIRLSYDKVKSILDGDDDRFEEYVSELFDQIDTEMSNNNKFSFIEYLTLQIDSLSNICISELKSNFTNKELETMIVDSKYWVSLSQKSSIFNDYYSKYIESKGNKKLFFNLLRKLVAKI